MRSLAPWTAVAIGCLWSSTGSAAPKQRRDYFLDPPQKGLWAHGDVLTLGVQASLESRTPIEDETFGTLSFRASSLASIGFGEAAAHVDIRYLFVTFGASAGYRHVWQTFRRPDGTEVPRDFRNDTDPTGESWGWGEGRGRLVIPLDRLWLVSNHAVRWEDSPRNTFDWFHTNVHDGGVLYRGDAVLFVRSESLGAIGPYVRYMDMPRNDARRGELSAGFIYGVRLGLKKRDDLLNVIVLTRPGDDEFGFHVLRLPLWTMVVYRASFRLLEY
jgi:hypothetical protein